MGDYVFYNATSLTSVTFDDASGWYTTYDYSKWINKTGGTAMELTDASVNAKYLKSTYGAYYWYKE